MIRLQTRAMIGALALVALSTFGFRASAQDPVKLESIDVQTLSGQQVQLKLHLNGPAPAPLAMLRGRHRQRMGREREQPPREVLQPYGRGAGAPRGRNGKVEPHGGDHRDDLESDLRRRAYCWRFGSKDRDQRTN